MATSTHNPRIPDGFPFGGNYRKTSGTLAPYDPFWSSAALNAGPGVHFVANFSHHSFGGLVGGGIDDRAVTGLMLCPPEAFADFAPGPTKVAAFDLARCVPFTRNEMQESTAGWVKVRRAWDKSPAPDRAKDGFNPEHMYIVQAAAARAGFDKIDLLKKPSFVRYPTRDAFIRTRTNPPLRDDESHDPTGATGDSVVGQSWIPRPWSVAGASAVRAVYLPELAQMPDVTATVWDWASGGETCPFAGIIGPDGKSVFGGDDHSFDVNGCHDYKSVLGPLNASHFLPLSHDYWRYYHALARGRMATCKELSTKLAPLYAEVETYYATAGVPLRRFRAAGDDEVHECEREAFVFEMFAQHYLADAWATGHMWKRWGYSDLNEFPANLLGFPGEPENEAGQRLAVAGVTAMYSGMLHGAKGAMAPLYRSLESSSSMEGWAAKGAVWLAGQDIFDDPLSGPYYFDLYTMRPPPGLRDSSDLSRTSWSDGFGLGIHPGVGDLYYRPSATSGSKTGKNPLVRLDDEDTPMFEQRTRLLDCAGASLREVYLDGPLAHGTLGDAGYGTGSVDPNGDSCWNHWATNASIAASLGPFMWARQYTIDPDTDLPIPADTETTAKEGVIAMANGIAVNEAMAVGSFPDKENAKHFTGRLFEAVTASHMALTAALASNAHEAKDGIHSAQMKHVTGIPLTPFMFEVQPNQSWFGGMPKPDHYLDRASPRPLVESDQYVRRMFWRSHLQETCREGRSPDPVTGKSTIETLRDRCVNAAPFGGDPEACTACVELAEIHIPHTALVGFDNKKSKCDQTATIPYDLSSLPPEFFSLEGRSGPEYAARLEANNWVGGAPPWWAAVSYCTDTVKTSHPLVGGGVAEKLVSVDSKDERASACDSENPYSIVCEGIHCHHPDTTPTIGTHTKLREAVVRMENDLSGTALPSATVTAVEITYTAEETVTTGSSGNSICTPWISDDTGISLFGVISDLNGVAQPTDDLHPRNPSYIGSSADLMLGTCGQTQRFTWWDKDCLAVDAAFPRVLPLDWRAGYDPVSGLLANTSNGPDGTSSRCELAEPRTIGTICPHTTTCGSGGWCRAAPVGGGVLRYPPVYYFDELPVKAGDVCDVKLQGGPYNNLCKELGVIEAHHLPSSQSWWMAGWPYGLNHETAPAIRMSYADHKCTASSGSSDNAKRFRSDVAALLRQRKLREALDKEIADVRECAGSKYDDAILQMESYLRKKGLIL